MRLVLLTALAAGAAGLLPATASAGPDVRTFRAEVEGVQTTTWSEDYPPFNQCDQGATGSGRETVSFASSRPFTIRAYRFGRRFVRFGDGSFGSADVITRARVDRRGQMVARPIPPTCLGTGGGGRAT